MDDITQLKFCNIFMKRLLLLLIYFSTMSNANSQTLQTVETVDLNRYSGKWFEIASYPQYFQKGCTCTTADYTVTDKGYILVENRCKRDSVNGKISYIRGKAFVEDNSGNAKLKVQFFWPFRGKYWIIDLAEDYSFAVVSHPNKKYLWVLSRTSKMDEVTYQQITNRLKEKGFELNKLQTTKQN